MPKRSHRQAVEAIKTICREHVDILTHTDRDSDDDILVSTRLFASSVKQLFKNYFNVDADDIQDLDEVILKEISTSEELLVFEPEEITVFHVIRMDPKLMRPPPISTLKKRLCPQIKPNYIHGGRTSRNYFIHHQPIISHPDTTTQMIAVLYNGYAFLNGKADFSQFSQLFSPNMLHDYERIVDVFNRTESHGMKLIPAPDVQDQQNCTKYFVGRFQIKTGRNTSISCMDPIIIFACVVPAHPYDTIETISQTHAIEDRGHQQPPTRPTYLVSFIVFPHCYAIISCNNRGENVILSETNVTKLYNRNKSVRRKEITNMLSHLFPHPNPSKSARQKRIGSILNAYYLCKLDTNPTAESI